MCRAAKLLAILIAAASLSACAGHGTGPHGELDASQLVRTEPADLRVIDILPRGIGSTGEAILELEVFDEDPRVAAQEAFDLARADERFEADAARTVVTYVLQPQDHTRFAQVMVRLRAQLLIGYGRVAVSARTGICDEAGVTLTRGRAPTVIQNAETGRMILALAPVASPRDLKRRAPYCL